MYKSLGDVNFFDTGRLVKHVDDKIYEVITCDLDSNGDGNHYFLNEFSVDFDDFEPGELHDVCACSGDRDLSIDYTDCEYEILAVDICTYGKISPQQNLYLTKNEVIDFIDHGYINEIEWEFYESNFYETNRNCVVRICQNDGIGMASTEIYNTLEDALKDFERRAEKGWSIEVIDK